MSYHWGNWANNIAPIAGVKADSVVCVSKQVTFDGSDSYDPDGTITEWRWDPGDGTGYLYGEVVSHTYSSAGDYTVTLRVTDNGGATATATAVVSVKSGWVWGKAHFPDADETPLNGLKVNVTMYYEDPDGNIRYFYAYPPVYSSSSGYYGVDVSTNPFSIFSYDYWLYVWYGGWNRIAITAQACNGQQTCLSSIVHNVCTYAKISMAPHHTHKLIFKDSATGEYLTGVKATYYDGYESLPALESGGGSSVQWNDADPVLITHVITKDGYRIRTPIIDHRGIDVSSECYTETDVLMDKLLSIDTIIFDKLRYHPQDKMEISYNTVYLNARVKLYDPLHNLVMLYLCGTQTVSPPPVEYQLPASVVYGQWLAVLEDPDGNDVSHATAFVGTQGILSYDISGLCTNKKVNIGFADIDPVFKPGAPPNNMVIQLYDATNHLLGTYSVYASGGTATYTLTGSEDLSDKWTAKLIDQWNNVVDFKRISVFRCNQVIIGRVRRLNGNPVKNCKVTLDLSFMGFGIFQVTTDATGGFKFTGLPPFPNTYVSSYKPGYKKLISEVSLGEDEFKSLHLVLEGLIKGTVTDEESKPVANAYVILEGGGAFYEVVETTRDDGNYDLPPKVTGYQNLRVMKNNFNVEEDSVNIEEISENALQIVKNMQLTRRALDLFDANFKRTNIAFETSLVQLDRIDIANIPAGIMELTNSSQKIALIQAITGAGQSQNVGIPGLLYETGDVTCEYYGDDENGKPIIRCSYTNRLEI